MVKSTQKWISIYLCNKLDFTMFSQKFESIVVSTWSFSQG